MTDENETPNIQANNNRIAVGNIQVDGAMEGSLILGSNNVVRYTSEQVSTLITLISTTFQPKTFNGRSPYIALN